MSGAGKGREKGDADTPAAEESLNITSLPDLYVGHMAYTPAVPSPEGRSMDCPSPRYGASPRVFSV